MNRPTRAFARLGVAGLSAVTIGAGLAAFATPASAAVTGITIAPGNATISTGDNTCQTFTATATGATAGDKITVTLSGSNPQFCGPTATSPQDFPLTVSGTTGTVTFGVNQSTPVAGVINISAKPMGSTTGPTSNTAVLHVVTAPHQADAVTTLQASPPTQAGTGGSGTAHYDVTATAGAGGGIVSKAAISYTVKSSEGGSVGSSSGTCMTGLDGTTDGPGGTPCNVPVPATLVGQTSPYTVTFSSGPTAAPVTTTAQLATSTAAPGNATIALSCGTTSTERTSLNDCVVPTSATSEVITAGVTTPATSTGGSPVPVPGVLVTFTASPAGNSSSGANLPSCVTGANGRCTTTLTFASGATGTTTVTGTLSNGQHADAHVQLSDTFAASATNISVSAASPTANASSGDLVTATVTNQFGNPVQGNVSVFFSVGGVGILPNGTTTQTVSTAPNGQAQILVKANGNGSATVTAAIQPSEGTGGTNCQSAAPAGGGGVAGNCTAQTTITFGNSTPPPNKVRHEHPVITAIHARHPGRATIHVASHPRVAGASVHYYKISKSGNRHLIGKNRTNSEGKAKMQFRGLKHGKTYKFQVKVYSGHTPGVKPGYSARQSQFIK